MAQPTFVIDRHHIEPPLRRLEKLPLRKQAKIVANHSADRPPLFPIHRRLSGFHIARGAGLDLDEAQYIFVPPDQVDLSVMPRRSKITRHHDVSSAAQIEISIFLAAAAGTLVRGGLGVAYRGSADEAIDAAEESLG